MTKNDQDLIAEAYDKVNEGLFDRIKARTAQATGAIKGAGAMAKGVAQSAAGKAVGLAGAGIQQAVDAVYDDAPQKNKLVSGGKEIEAAGAKKVRAGKAGGQEAKFKSYITNSAKTIAKDLAELGMEVDDTDALMNDIRSVVSKHLTQVTGQGQLRDATGKVGGKVGVKN